MTTPNTEQNESVAKTLGLNSTTRGRKRRWIWIGAGCLLVGLLVLWVLILRRRP